MTTFAHLQTEIGLQLQSGVSGGQRDELLAKIAVVSKSAKTSDSNLQLDKLPRHCSPLQDDAVLDSLADAFHRETVNLTGRFDTASQLLKTSRGETWTPAAAGYVDPEDVDALGSERFRSNSTFSVQWVVYTLSRSSRRAIYPKLLPAVLQASNQHHQQTK